jgi:uncharacterized protein
MRTFPSSIPSLLVSVAAIAGIALLAGCSRVPEEPNPVVKEMRPMPGTMTAAKGPAPTNACPTDPEPSKNTGTFYGHGRAAFVTPAGTRHEFAMEIAASPDAQERGLMYRTSLAEDAGMVFVFPVPHHAVFWMRNTCIPLDMVFVNEENRVIGVVTAPPLDESPREVPGFSKYVVELAAGVAQKRGIAIGTIFVPPP